MVSLCSAELSIPKEVLCNVGNWHYAPFYYFLDTTKQVFNEFQELIGHYEVVNGMHRITQSTLQERQAYRELLDNGLTKDYRTNGIIQTCE